jgi:hypothetical protein
MVLHLIKMHAYMGHSPVTWNDITKCIHVSDEYELGRKEVPLQSFKYVAYDIDGG